MLVVHDEPESRHLTLKKVGVRNVVGQVYVSGKSIPATFSLYCMLPENLKGVHMSRFTEVLYLTSALHGGVNLSRQDGLRVFLSDLLRKHSYSNKVYSKARFSLLRTTLAPVTGRKSFDMSPIVLEASLDKKDQLFSALTFEVSGFTCCPCALRETKGKATHAQRATARVSFICDRVEIEWLNRLIGSIEECFSVKVTSCLKRTDEAYLVLEAFSKPKFVEDVARDIALVLKSRGFEEYAIVVNSYESIHRHDATAVLTEGRFR